MSKGIAENLVGYAKADLMVPQAPFGDLAAANAAAAAWCAEVNGAVRSEICAVPAERLVTERNCWRRYSVPATATSAAVISRQRSGSRPFATVTSRLAPR